MSAKVGWQTLIWLAVSQCLIMLSIWSHIDRSALLVCLSCWGWQIAKELGYPINAIKYLIVAVTLYLCFDRVVHIQQLGVLSVMASLLVLGFSLKLLELKYRRDIFALVLVGCFTIALSCLFYNDTLHNIQASVLFIINIGVSLILVRQSVNNQQIVKQLAKMVLVSLPLTLLLFYFFPRLPPLWSVNQNSPTEIGLSDSMSPGNVTKLTQSNELVFTARFEHTPPDNSALYWRALVLEDFDGETWQQNPMRKRLTNHNWNGDRQLNPVFKQGTPLRYTVTALGSDQPWLYGLDRVTLDSKELAVARDYSIHKFGQSDNIQYQAQSFLKAPLNSPISIYERRLNTQVPAGNPRTRAWVNELREQGLSGQQVMAQVMQRFAQQNYRYSLEPPKMFTPQQDDFLFNKKVGFCMHYASAMATIARLYGLPTRVVLGYQGGVVDAKHNTLSVYQYMAHAWVEVWLDELGWQRYDPTSVVSPTRIGAGFDDYLDEQLQQYSDDYSFAFRLRNQAWFQALAQWSQQAQGLSDWFSGYNQQKQTQWMEQMFGDKAQQGRSWILASGLLLILMVTAWWLGLFRKSTTAGAYQQQYQLLCGQLRRYDIELSDGETPKSLLTKVAQQYPHSKSAAMAFYKEFERVEFGQGPQQIKRLKLAKRALLKSLSAG
ncbi:transglutaminaseTgpA domain-containing protein [Paraferrimonas haliotis]|uniref:Transglutaminase n=1 Tax=Paraferrimonas haliotis TaxID=2013866 RepID=A0AA37WYP5_9GAMM|nr:DUF3488 and transglutaminase-like domain-containing protein [Paraferrimonas haliotis]GLS84724.1 transglutaminase [Paraferrimonas haliotis]